MFNFLRLFKFLKSTILIKIVMALTGLAIVGFLFAHAIGNLQFWVSPDVYNTYAAFLQEPFGLAEVLWILRVGLILCLILHIISAVYLRLKNNAAKPIGYQVKNYAKAKLTSRTMLWTGLMVLAGIVFHILHFTTGTIDFNDGYETYEVYPTGGYVMGLSGCTDKNICDDAKKGCDSKTFFKADACSGSKEQCCKTKSFFKADACCSNKQICKTECSDKPCQVASKECSDKPCQDVGNKLPLDKETIVIIGDNQVVVICCGDTMLVRETGDTVTAEEVEKFRSEGAKLYREANPNRPCQEVVRCGLQAKKSCCANCPSGDEMCAKCKENPEQCSKFAKMKCADKPCQTACKTDSKCATKDKCKTSSCCKDDSGCCGMPTFNTYEKANPGEVYKYRHDVYGMVAAEFSCPWVALAYIIFVILVGFHLNHAIQSGIHTLGIEGPKFTPVMRVLSTLLSAGLVLLFIILPLGVVVNNLLGCNCILGGL